MRLLANGKLTTTGFESILDSMCTFLEPWSLEWHYRSRDESLIAKLERQPGQKEARYAHLLGGPVDAASLPAAAEKRSAAPDSGRLETLETELASLKNELAEFKAIFDEFRKQFD